MVERTSTEEISCSDIIFDKQRLDDCIIQQGCGWYHMNHQRSNLELANTIRIDNGQYLTMMLNLSSIKFLKLYTNKYITFSVRIRDICITEDYFILPNYIRKVVMLINENEGFTCVFWYKQWAINDMYLWMKKVTNKWSISKKNIWASSGQWWYQLPYYWATAN